MAGPPSGLAHFECPSLQHVLLNFASPNQNDKMALFEAIS